MSFRIQKAHELLKQDDEESEEEGPYELEKSMAATSSKPAVAVVRKKNQGMRMHVTPFAEADVM